MPKISPLNERDWEAISLTVFLNQKTNAIIYELMQCYISLAV